MTYAELAAYVRFKTRKNSTTFTDADILASANVWKDDFAVRVAKRNEDFFRLEFLTDLIADQRQYQLPDEAFQIKYVEALIDGTNWRHLREFDLNSFPQGGGSLEDPLDLGVNNPDSLNTTDETSIRRIFAQRRPMFELMDKSIFLYTGEAITNVTDGLKLNAIIFPAKFTDLTSTTDMSVPPSSVSHGIPRQFHELLARRIIIDYKESRDKPLPLTEKEVSYEADFDDMLDAVVGQNLDRVQTAKTPYMDGSDF